MIRQNAIGDKYLQKFFQVQLFSKTQSIFTQNFFVKIFHGFTGFMLS